MLSGASFLGGFYEPSRKFRAWRFPKQCKVQTFGGFGVGGWRRRGSKDARCGIPQSEPQILEPQI